MRFSASDTRPAYKPTRPYSNTPETEWECKQWRMLKPEEYLANGYEPMSAEQCLWELESRSILHHLTDEAVFWYNRIDIRLTPGLIASIDFHACNIAVIMNEDKEYTV